VDATCGSPRVSDQLHGRFTTAMVFRACTHACITLGKATQSRGPPAPCVESPSSHC
jgi:hypothetical protein